MDFARTPDEIHELVNGLNFKEKVDRSLRLIGEAREEFGDGLVVALCSLWLSLQRRYERCAQRQSELACALSEPAGIATGSAAGELVDRVSQRPRGRGLELDENRVRDRRCVLGRWTAPRDNRVDQVLPGHCLQCRLIGREVLDLGRSRIAAH